MYKIIFLGPQGCGKGTQASLLAKDLNIPAISMGELLRDKAAKEHTDLTADIEHKQKAGDLVDDKVALEVLKEHAHTIDMFHGYIIDGYPRNEAQANTYLTYDEPTHVIVIDVPREESIRRLLKRAEIEKRADDWTDIIEHRLDVYEHDTKPLLEIFAKMGNLHVIDGMRSIEEIHSDIAALFQTK